MPARQYIVDGVNDVTSTPELEDVLELENEKYQEGFEEGKKQPTIKELLEGKEYGIQTGFQRALIVGYIQGLIQDWKLNESEYTSRGFKSHLEQLDALINSVTLTNQDEAVAEYEQKLHKARNKLRLVANMAGETWKAADLDKVLGEVGGTMKVSSNVEEMW